MNRTLAINGLLLLCALTFALPTRAQSVQAFADVGTADVGVASRPIENVASNDIVGGAAATLGATGNAKIGKVGVWPTGLGLDPTTGAVSTTIALPVGAYSVQYQLCDKTVPPACVITTDLVTVINAAVNPLPESGNASAGAASTPIANVLANDTVHGVAATLGADGNASLSQTGSWPTGIVLDTATGAITVSAAVPAGSYSINYRLCDRNAPVVCASTTDTITVTTSIKALPESGVADGGVASRPIANVAANDSINGAAAVLGPSGNATVAQVGGWPTGIALTPSTGAVSTTVAVAAGTYNITYKLCDKSVPTVCATATDSVKVISAAVHAVADAGTADAGVASRPIANVFANDSVNGATVTLGPSGNATVSVLNTSHSGVALTPSTGAISTTVAVPVGTYTVSYQLCDRNVPALCDTATATVTVVPGTVSPAAESGTADAGVASRPIANVAANDSVHGTTAILGAAGNATVAQVGSWPTGIALTPSTGAVSTKVAVPAGNYNVQYRLCDRNVPAVCANMTDTVKVITASINAVPESGSATVGVASRPIANVAANDTVNGAAVTLGPTGNASVAQTGTWPTGIALTPSTGAVSTTIAVPAGSYSIQYRLCDRNTPAVCATATDTVTVSNAAIVANPDAGSAATGKASAPIANVAANDTVRGAAATLGASGNATVAKVGTWPAGFSLNPATGAVNTAATVPAGNYSIAYQLCDRNAPPACASAIDTVTVIVAAIVANPDAGTATTGVASRPIANVVANDSVNGAAVTLGTAGNATVARVGTWPTGISLTTTTGAVRTTTAVLPGVYDMQYQLCDVLAPPDCATANIRVTVATAIAALPVAGSAIVGRSSTAIGNVLAKSSVNGVRATLGTSGNATVAKVGSWPSGLSLIATNGQVYASATVPEGNYTLGYQLCDKNVPVNCANSFANVAIVQPLAEVRESPYVIGDVDFDWARDGLYCAQCNSGFSNSQFSWTDRNNNLWVSGIDPNTGAFTPISGRQGLADTNAFFWQDWGNGPEWAFSTPPGSSLPVSQLVYTRFAPGQTPTWQFAGAAMASQTDGVWSASFLPGAYTPIANNTVLPEASQCNADPISQVVFTNLQTPAQMFTEDVSTSGSFPALTPFGAYANGIGERWVPCTHWLTFQGTVTIGSNTLQQVFLYNTDSQAVEQLTFDYTTKQRAEMFKAPEFLGQQYPYMLTTLAADSQIQIYRQNGWSAGGAPTFELYNTIYSPDPTQTFIFNPKQFIHCSPDCHTYIVMALSHTVNSQRTQSQPNGLAVANVDPQNPMFVVLASAASLPYTQRLDPEYFITANGPIVSYESLLTVTNTTPYESLGRYMINLRLGPPSGPCVGSSAERGLVGPQGTCQ